MLLYCAMQTIVGAEAISKSNPSESLNFFNAQNRIEGLTLQFSEGYISVDGEQLHYVAAGTGKLVVFYHGFPSYWYMWKDQLTALGQDYRVVAVDGLGANLSDKPDQIGAYAIHKLARQLRQFIQSLAGEDPFVLVGHDWGGALAWAYAQQYPQGLEKLIVLSAPPYNLFLDLLQSDPAQQQASQYVEHLKTLAGKKTLGQDEALSIWQAGYGKLIEQDVISKREGEQFRNALVQPGALLGGINWYRANIPAPPQITESDYWPSQSANTSIDSLLIWGGSDMAFVPAFLKKLPAYASQLQIQVLPGIGHWPSLEAPDTVNQLMRKFIASED